MTQLTIDQAFQIAVEHHQAGRLGQAEHIYRQILAQQPNYVDAMHLLGVLAHQAGRNDIAVDLIRQALALRPDWSEAFSNLGSALQAGGQLDEAIAAYRQAIALNANFPEAHNNLGNALRKKGRLDEAIAAYRQAIALEPDYPDPHLNLGNALRENGQLDEAIVVFTRAVALEPDFADAHSTLANALNDNGQSDRAIAAYRQALALRGDAGTHSNLVYALHFNPNYDASAICQELREWDRRYAEPPLFGTTAHSNDRNPERRLRIGYVSPDFRDHVVGRNLVPLFRERDRGQFDVTCYAQLPRPDAMTHEFQQHSDRFHNIAGLSDEQVASLVRHDQIDILVDLTLHMAYNRLLVFARKPAPVQVTFAGYPGSTGLTAIDYRLSDPYLDPPGTDESVYSEQTIRLPDSFWCYDPLECRDIAVNSLPALNASSGQTGRVTFGCLNNFWKVNEPVLGLWAQVLRRVDGSRLMLLADPGSPRQRTLEFLNTQGIEPDRVEFIPRQPRRQYLQLYHRIDLCLDTFPYNGHTTSLDSCWMGVPVVTLVGATPVSRAGWSQLSNLGLTELAGETPDTFTRIAVDLAGDLSRLSELRSTLRRRMEQSPLMDAPRFARNIESAYRRMWRTWCATAPAAGGTRHGPSS